MTERIYICGPMTGLPDENRPAFDAAAARLRACGLNVHSPSETPRGLTWEQYMRLGLAELVKCTGIAVLPGWDRSRGACLEVQVATDLGLRVGSVETWVEREGGWGTGLQSESLKSG